MDYKITTYLGFSLFLISEALSLIQKTKGNGILHGLICLLSGSECVVHELKKVVEEVVESEEDQVKKKELEIIVDEGIIL
jgi:hypothetical protein